MFDFEINIYVAQVLLEDGWISSSQYHCLSDAKYALKKMLDRYGDRVLDSTISIY